MYLLRRVKRQGAMRYLLRLAGDPTAGEVTIAGFNVYGDNRSSARVEFDVMFDPRRRLTLMRGVRSSVQHQVGALPRTTVTMSRDAVACGWHQ
jgi:hypothetical protein